MRGGHPTRNQFFAASDLSQSHVSNHLGCVRGCGLVVAERNGRFITYHLRDDRVGDILALAESLLADVARGVYECTRYGAPQSTQKDERSE